MNMTEKLRYGKGRRIPVILVMIALLFSAFIPAATQSAYAADGTATAICVCDGININQKLVELGYSKDVSLN